ncbi:MAG: NBR1-Ig-like domain-containing protein [Chloroflexi bacterium]|nr:NBR1-Ig-like domain-containing protein [Chloroflexota bacterium]
MKPTIKTNSTLTGLAVILTVILSACGASATPNPTADVSIFYTQAAATIALGLTQTSQAMPSATPPAPTSTPEPSLVPTQNSVPAAPAVQNTIVPTPQQSSSIIPTPIPVDPATARGCYNAAFVSDVTIKFAPTFNSGDRFTKTWRIKNTGSCDWPRGFQIIFVSGDRFGAESSVIDQKVITGATADISLAMTAPYLTGVVTSNWMLATDIGKPFGPVLSAAITLPAGNSGATSSGGCLNSILVSDVSIPTGTQLNANENFTKTWLVKNTGSCEWNGNFKITYVGGDLLGADTTKIRKTVGAGTSAEISLDMTAPGSTGTISSAWQLASDDGQLFGQLFAFSIVVK